MRSAITKLSIFTVFTVFITVALATVIGNFSLFAKTYTIDAAFDDATGVLVGDLVKIGGVNVGRVTGFKIEKGQAKVDLKINAGIELPENTIAEIKYRNLLGQRVINLVEPEISSDETLADGDSIPSTNTRPALDLALVFNNLRPLIQSTNPEEINTVARGVLEVFEGNEGDLEGILGNVGEVTETLADRGGRLARLVKNLNGVTKVLNGESTSIRSGLDRFTEFTESLAEVTPTIERVVTKLNDASGRFDRIIRRNRDNIDQELKDLATVLGIVNDNLGPVDVISKNLKEVLLATARSQSYGKWWTLYVVNLCPEALTPGCAGLPD